MKTATFKDFSPHLPSLWTMQAEGNQSVSVYKKHGSWCREVRNVRVVERDGWLVPEPGQLVSYPQKIP